MNRLRRHMLSILLLAWILDGVASADEAPEWIPVNYVSATSIYLGAGRTRGLAVGDLLEVVRDGRVIAELVVAFVAEQSASCRIRGGSSADLRPGDQARIAQKAPPLPGTSPPEPANPVPVERAEVVKTPPQKRVVTPPPRRSVSRPRTYRPGIDPWARLTGSMSLRFQSFQDGTANARDFDE